MPRDHSFMENPMAKDDDKKTSADADKFAAEAAAKESEAKAKVEADTRAAAEAKAQEGLVKMHKDGRYIHAHPSTVKHHESNGWKLA